MTAEADDGGGSRQREPEPRLKAHSESQHTPAGVAVCQLDPTNFNAQAPASSQLPQVAVPPVVAQEALNMDHRDSVRGCNAGSRAAVPTD